MKLGCNDSLPTGWKWQKAQDCMDVRDGTHDSPKYVSEGYPLVTSKNLINGKIDFLTCTFISKEDHEAISKRSAVDDGDILYAMIGTIGNPVIVEKKQEFSIKNVALFKFNNENIFNRYIYHFLNSSIASRQFDNVSRGGTQKFVSLGNIRNLQIPLPPLPEQKRIAAILDKADSLRRKNQQAIQLADKFLRAVFLELFGDPMTNPKEWDKQTLGDLIKVSSGNGLTASQMDKDGKFPVYGGNGINGYHNDYMFEEPQIVIGRVGVYCGSIHITWPKSWITDNALYVKEYKQEIDIHFLAESLKQANLNQYAGKAAQPLISGSRIYPLEFIIPPIQKQKEFSKIKKNFQGVLEKFSNSSSCSEIAFNAISQKAFSGHL